jgi:hypothetical protein
MEHCSETSAFKIQTPGNYPEESIRNLRDLQVSYNMSGRKMCPYLWPVCRRYLICTPNEGMLICYDARVVTKAMVTSTLLFFVIVI